MTKVEVRELAQLPFLVVHMVVYQNYIVVLSNAGKLYKVELIDD